jgi:hypothetical protein
MATYEEVLITIDNYPFQLNTGDHALYTLISNGRANSPVLQSTDNFFAPLATTGGLYNPRVVYDRVNQRFVVSMDYGASGATVSSINIAVSKDSNPNDGWYFSYRQ